MQGIERADSVVLDPHKGLFLPYGTGSLLVRRASDLLDAHRIGPAPADQAKSAASGSSGSTDRPAYMTSGLDYFNTPDDPLLTDFQRCSPELSRPFRGLRVWLPLKLHGVEPFRRNLDEKLDLAQLAGIEFGQMRGHLVAAGLKGDISGVSGGVLSLVVTEVVEILMEFLEDFCPACQQGLVQADQSVLSCHGCFTSVYACPPSF